MPTYLYVCAGHTNLVVTTRPSCSLPSQTFRSLIPCTSTPCHGSSPSLRLLWLRPTKTVKCQDVWKPSTATSPMPYTAIFAAPSLSGTSSSLLSCSAQGFKVLRYYLLLLFLLLHNLIVEFCTGLLAALIQHLIMIGLSKVAKTWPCSQCSICLSCHLTWQSSPTEPCWQHAEQIFPACGRSDGFTGPSLCLIKPSAVCCGPSLLDFSRWHF